MFDYRFNRDAVDYAERLRKEAQNARLARGHTSRLARVTAGAFRTLANRLDGGAKPADQIPTTWDQRAHA